jgi:hypothetical protein
MARVVFKKWPLGDELTVTKDSVSLSFDPLVLDYLMLSEAIIKIKAA